MLHHIGGHSNAQAGILESSLTLMICTLDWPESRVAACFSMAQGKVHLSLIWDGLG